MSLQVVSVCCLILRMDQALSIQTSLSALFLEYGWGDKLRRITGRDEVAFGYGNLWILHDYAIAISGFPGTHKFLLLDNGMQFVVFLRSWISLWKSFCLEITHDCLSKDKWIKLHGIVEELWTVTDFCWPDQASGHMWKRQQGTGEGKLFSCGNLWATFDNPEYEKVLSKALETLWVCEQQWNGFHVVFF